MTEPDPTADRSPIGRRVAVRVETPRGSFVKRDLVGGKLRVAFVSPLPCPFDYGQVEGEDADDGLGKDGVWLGARAKALDVVHGVVAAIARFEDGGLADDKWIVTADGRLPARDALRIVRFFRFYAFAKRARGVEARFRGLLVRGEREPGGPNGEPGRGGP